VSREHEDAGEFRPAILMPTYNNAGTLPDIVNRSRTLGLPIIVVNDGCLDGTALWLASNAAGEACGRLHVVTHSVNRGKAVALQSGFAKALELGCTHAVTIDTDG
jgi:glycosyltransferase involved in cell wall biosynthesis